MSSCFTLELDQVMSKFLVFREPEILRDSGSPRFWESRIYLPTPFPAPVIQMQVCLRQCSAPCSHSCATFYCQLHMNPYFWIRYSGKYLSWKSLCSIHPHPVLRIYVCRGLNRFLYPSLNIVGAIRAATVTRVRWAPCRFSKTCSQTSAPEWDHYSPSLPNTCSPHLRDSCVTFLADA